MASDAEVNPLLDPHGNLLPWHVVDHLALFGSLCLHCLSVSSDASKNRILAGIHFLTPMSSSFSAFSISQSLPMALG